MKYRMALLALFFCFQLALMAQKPKSDQAAPKEDIKVNREYDEKGNLIKFDSVYSYSWSGDTTLTKAFPKDFPNLFGDHLGSFPDSAFFENFFSNDLDRSFFKPFSSKKDSLLNLHGFKHFRNFQFKNDSISSDFLGFGDFFGQFNGNKHDSISSKAPGASKINPQAKSMNGMMKMMEQQMKEMEEYQRKFFK